MCVSMFMFIFHKFATIIQTSVDCGNKHFGFSLMQIFFFGGYFNSFSPNLDIKSEYDMAVAVSFFSSPFHCLFDKCPKAFHHESLAS